MATSSTSPRVTSNSLAHETVFPILFLIGRPAAGKSEVIKYLRELDSKERAAELHVGDFHELDDFPMIWSWFEEDEILARHGRKRLHSDSEGYFLDNFEWNVLIERLDLEYRKWVKECAPEGDRGDDGALALPRGKTAVIEFARGKEHGGLKDAFSYFSEDLLRRGAVLYINVSFSESLRKNRRRFNPDKPHSILEHALPDDKLERLYGESDWDELSAEKGSFLRLKGVQVPYSVMENEDDVTTKGGELLGGRLRESLDRLWSRHLQRKP
ncbi:MAG TPA: hypothetical protein VMW69_02510 [Spirochaetia bacterium]|nr:hypothetical protein [Spirochaetia bacterium]